MAKLRIFTPAGDKPFDLRDGAIRQMQTCLNYDFAVAGALNADHHLGYSMPIGGVAAYIDHISPSGVGYDIGCGNLAVATSLLYSDIKSDMLRIMDEIVRRISFGMGQPAAEQVADHPIYDEIAHATGVDSAIPGMLGLARKQLGTVGGGNHYVDIFVEDRTGRVWIGNHFGSRGFGHRIASGYLARAEGKDFNAHASGGEMYSPPVLFHVDEWLGQSYINAMELAGRYAYAGREVVAEKVLEILGADAIRTVHNHHNFAWQENYCGENVWVVRKGCTPLYGGQQGFVGGSMGENAVIIEGKTWHMDEIKGDATGFDAAIDSIHSAPHGAGRLMSRTEAKGRRRKRLDCTFCGRRQGAGESWTKVTEGFECPACGKAGTSRVWVQETQGRVDWNLNLKYMSMRGIVLRGGDADEAPLAYKRLPAVLEAHSSYVDIKHTLRPVGVAMAGSGVRDDYKD